MRFWKSGSEIDMFGSKRPKKTQKPTELALNFLKNQKLLKSVHGARRTVVSNAITLRGGVPTESVILLLEIHLEPQTATHVLYYSGTRNQMYYTFKNYTKHRFVRNKNL